MELHSLPAIKSELIFARALSLRRSRGCAFLQFKMIAAVENKALQRRVAALENKFVHEVKKLFPRFLRPVIATFFRLRIAPWDALRNAETPLRGLEREAKATDAGFLKELFRLNPQFASQNGVSVQERSGGLQACRAGEVRLQEPVHLRVPDERCGRAVLHGGQHPHPGGASGHRDGHRPRPGRGCS